MKIQRFIFRVLDKLVSEHSRLQLRLSAILGVSLAFSPVGTLHWLFFGLIALLLRTNLLVVFLAYVAFTPFALVLDPIAHRIGLHLLTGISALHPYWAWLLHAPLLPYTEFNNTVVLGRFIIACALAPLIFLFLRFFGPRMLDYVLTAFKRTHFWRKWVYSRIG